MESSPICPKATWAAIQREGQRWQPISLTPTALSLSPGEKIGLARIRGRVDPADSLQIYYVTTEQVAATFSCGDDTPPSGVAPTKLLNGTIRGVDTTALVPDALGQALATILIGSGRADAARASLTIADVPAGTADLVASTVLGSPAMMIIRRGVDYPDGSAIPVLDFESAEAFKLQQSTLTISGNPHDYLLRVLTGITTQSGTQAMLSDNFPPAGSTSVPVYSVPENKLVGGELNSLTVYTGFSFVTVFYRVPADRTVVLGPEANWPTITRSGTGSDPATRIDVVAQPEYGSQIVLNFGRPFNATVNPKSTITTSKEYFGATPATWTFVIPGLRAVGDFPSSFGDLRSSALSSMRVTDRPYLVQPTDGATYHWAVR